jgi:hypothetical protein
MTASQKQVLINQLPGIYLTLFRATSSITVVLSCT